MMDTVEIEIALAFLLLFSFIAYCTKAILDQLSVVLSEIRELTQPERPDDEEGEDEE